MKTNQAFNLPINRIFKNITKNILTTFKNPLPQESFSSHIEKIFIHWKIISIVFLLVSIGIGTIFLSSYHLSLKLVGHPYLFVNKQITLCLFSLPLIIIVYFIPIEKIVRLAPWIFCITLFSLILVFFPGIGKKISGAYRWIVIGPIQFQPSEIMKLALIIFFAFMAEKKQERIKDFKQGFIASFLIFSIPAFFISREPDFSTALIFFILGFIMLFMTTAPLVYLFFSAIIGFIFGLIFIQTKSYTLSRFLFINPNLDPYGKGYHIKLSLDSFKKGGWLGMKSDTIIPSLRHFPDTHNDFVFSVISRIGGVVGSSIVLILFMILFHQSLKIANHTKSKSEGMIIYGAIILFSLEVFLHIMVNTGIIPTTGILLPFISYGRTALIIHLILIVLILKIGVKNQASR